MKWRKVFLSTVTGLSLLCSAHNAAAQRYPDTDLNRGPLNLIRRESLLCGKGWRFPVLIWGDRPVSACILKTRQRNIFGGDF